MRKKNIIFKVSPQEDAMIGELANRMERSRSDTIRLLIRRAVRELSTPAGIEAVQIGEGAHDRRGQA